MSDQTIYTFSQLQGAVLPYGYDVNPFATANGLTISDITAASDDASVTVGNETVTNGVWEGELTGVSTGTATITLTTTFTSSTVVRKRKFKVTVT